VPVLSLTGNLARWRIRRKGIVAGGGANLAQLCRAAVKSGLGGLEDVAGQRGSVGGLVHATVRGMARAQCRFDWIELQPPGRSVERWEASAGEETPPIDLFRRRTVTRARVHARPVVESEAAVVANIPHPMRRALRSVDTVFLDTETATATDLLQEAGVVGAVSGGVRLGAATANELVAGRSATASDVLELCRRARDRVMSVTGIELCSTLVFLDEEGREVTL
jgi:UDP-N-acetylenolpyruvoylglucosamine reductase